MRWKRLVLGLCCCTFLLSDQAFAATGTLKYSINGGTEVSFTSEQDRTITLPSSVNGTVLLRIWDDDPDSTSGLPDDGIGKITISGSWTSGELRVLIAGTGDSWPGAAGIELTDPGLRDLGLNSGDGIEITDSDLRKHTRLAAYVSGDINGAIEVGQVQRIQCGFSTTNPTPGNINASITAIAPDALWGVDSIGRVYAGNSIAGNLTATGDSSFDPIYSSTYASIGRVVVGPDTGAAGITGDIKAEKGKIRAIYSTGPIGSVTITPKIYAANGIDEIRAIAEDTPGVYVASDFKADIRANVAYVAQLAYSTTEDAPVFLIRTAGGIAGQIRAGNVSWGPNLTPTHRGIMAEGPITADILIDLNLENADILGSSITGDVRIGLKAKGAIVATGMDGEDPNAGRIESVWIGYGEDLPEDYEETYPRGFVGNDAAPVNVQNPEDWYNPDPQSLDVGTQDSVIRGTSIGEVRLASMTQVYVRQFAPWKSYVPRVESPQIASLTIDDMRAGVVWSGVLEYNEFGGVANDPSNDYAVVEEVVIGCVGPGADLWLAACPRIEISGDLLGEVYLPVLESTETLWIGDRIGDGPNSFSISGAGDRCGGCEGFNEWECFYSYGGLIEDSPRDTGYADKGAVIIRDAQGLMGQIIINGNNTELAADTGWKGTVIVGAEDPESEDYIVLGPDEDALYEAPYYELPSGPLGGGAVGLAPFAFYPTDCVPPHNDPNPLVGIITTAFESGHPVLARWYGPVALPEGAPSAKSLLEVRVAWPFDECIETPGVNLTSIFTAALHTDGKARTLGIGANVQPRGVEHFLLWNDESEWGRLLCDEVAGDSPVTLAVMVCTGTNPVSERFIFRVHEDCDANDIADPVEIAGDPDLDMDNDGYLDSCLETNCLCDWNANQRIDIADIFLFLNDWFANDCAALCYGVSSPPCPTPNGSCGVAALFAFLNCWFNSFSDPLCNPE